MSKAEFLDQVELEDLAEYLEENNFPERYEAKDILEQIQNDELKPVALVEYLEDANQEFFDTPVVGVEVYRSDDAGQTWARTHNNFIDNVYFSYGYYFGEIRVAPQHPDRIYILGVPILKSEDGGKNFVSLSRDNTNIYKGLQFGNYVRVERDKGKRMQVKPQHELGERPLRFNWQTPIHL
jgi:hypothetical protein